MFLLASLSKSFVLFPQTQGYMQVALYIKLELVSWVVRYQARSLQHGSFPEHLPKEEGNSCCYSQAKLQVVKGQSWAGRNPSGHPGSGLSMCQLCGLAVLSTGTVIGDGGSRLSIARMLAPYVEEKIGLCVLKPVKFGGKSKPAVRLHSKHAKWGGVVLVLVLC